MAKVLGVRARAAAAMKWRTSLPTYGIVPELHGVFFAPLDDRDGPRACVALQIPEASPEQIRWGLAETAKRRARLLFVCDTQQQAEDAAALAASKLPLHRRIPYERARAGKFGPMD